MCLALDVGIIGYVSLCAMVKDVYAGMNVGLGLGLGAPGPRASLVGSPTSGWQRRVGAGVGSVIFASTRHEGDCPPVWGAGWLGSWGVGWQGGTSSWEYPLSAKSDIEGFKSTQAQFW